MSRANLIRPIRQVLSRPTAGQTRYVLPSLVSARSQASVPESKITPVQLTNELPHPDEENDVRLPRSVQALYLQPLRREAEYGVPSCDLQLRSFSIPNLEFFCDFALRAAYYLNLPAFGPVPLPKITERWTVPRSHFIFKKSQENFERITRRRLIQIRDGHPETVQVWLAFLQKHAYYGIGMKANMWEYGSLDTGKQMDSELPSMQRSIDEKMELLGQSKVLGTMLPIARTCCRRLPVSAARLSLSSAHRRCISSAAESAESNQPSHAVIFSGIQPTGIPHLGNYLGAMRQWKRLQDAAGEEDKLLFSIVDLHAITVPQDAEILKYRRREMLAALIAVGLDPEKSTLFYQSSVMQHSELMWILSCTASMGYLTRMTQYKSKLLAENKQADLEDAIASRLKLGLFSYPVLQAADILVHRATHVPVGDDQRQHLEFARECVTNFNHTYNQELFVPPETITSPSPRIMSLRDPYQKMSKSSRNDKSRILLTSSPEEITLRIMSAVTDSLNEVTYEPEERPGVANLLEIIAQCSPEPMTAADVADSLMGAKLGDLKAWCAQAVTTELSGIRERYSELVGRYGGKLIDDIEAEGAEVARRNAEETMRLVRDAVGLGSLR
ncbi:tryptophanyl-tRNA synthetase-like protein [Xylaria flabelliformis]|nr:tryptophanyl-tRNA synthetase-like protein [Xylaria flabelliformis]